MQIVVRRVQTRPTGRGGSRSSHTAHSQGAGRLVGTGRTGRDRSRTITADRQRATDKVGKYVLATVVRCTLGELDNAHGNSSPLEGCRGSFT